MTRKVAVLPPTASLGQAAEIMARLRISSIIVTESDRPVGILTERDMLRALQQQIGQAASVVQVMSAPVHTAPETLNDRAGYHLLCQRGIRHLAVTNAEGCLTGVLSESDFRIHLGRDYFEHYGDAAALMNRSPLTLAVETPLPTVLELMSQQRVSALLASEAGAVVGILTERDIVRLYNDVAPDRVLGDVINRPLRTVPLDASIGFVAARMSELRVRHLGVTADSGEVLGLIAEHDLVRPLELDTIDRVQRERRDMEARWQFALESTSTGVWDWDLESGKVYLSRQWKNNLGHGEGEVGDRRQEIDARLHPDDLPAARHALIAHLKGATPRYEAEFRLRAADGSYRWMLARGQVIERAPSGRALRLIGTHTDVTRTHEREAALCVVEAQQRSILEALSDSGVGLLVVDREHRVRYMNEMLKHTFGDQVGKIYALDTAQADTPPGHCPLAAVIERGETVRYQPTASNAHVYDVVAVPFVDSDGIVCKLEISRDITDARHAEEKLRLAASVFDHAHEGIMITDAKGLILEVNTTFTELTGYSHEETVGRSPSFLKSGLQPAEFYADMWRALAACGHWRGEVWNRRKDGRMIAELLTISTVKVSEQVSHYVGIFSDITALKESEQRLERLAFYDALTQLPNRVLLHDRLQLAISQALRSGRLLAVCHLDLDDFKEINERHGHAAGDRLLMAVAQRLKEGLRGEDTLARLGGDEFVVLLNQLSGIAECEQALVRLLSSLAQPFTIGLVQTVELTASIGVTLSPHDNGDADTLIRHADQAMYVAKQSGRNRYHLFDPVHAQEAQRHREMLARLSQALEHREFALYYQPKVNMRRGLVTGLEALIRWQHPERGLLPPSEFLPAIEASELVVPVGEWVLATAIAHLDGWLREGLQLAVSINVSARHLMLDDFAPSLQRLLARYPQVPPQCIELEITESAAIEEIEQVSAVIDACRLLGVQFSLDDFGTGYSSLTYFRRLPAQTLKIDQSFVRDMSEDLEDRAIIEGVIGLTRAFHRHVIAEGVETIEHGVRLMHLGCDFGQGYGIARPMHPDLVANWVRHYQPCREWALAAMGAWDEDALPLLLLESDFRQWLATLQTAVHETPSAAPPPAPADCHLGVWLGTKAAGRFGDYPALLSLQAAHEKLHAFLRLFTQEHRLNTQQAATRWPDIERLALATLTALHTLQTDVAVALEARLPGR